MSSNSDTALIVLGCPKLPVQTTAALYISSKLRNSGLKVTVAGTPAAKLLMKYADPDCRYINEFKDLDSVIDAIAEKKKTYPLCFVFIHNDAGISYAATINSIMNCVMYPVIFGPEADKISAEFPFECSKISAVCDHNPKMLIKEIDGAIKWDA